MLSFLLYTGGDNAFIQRSLLDDVLLFVLTGVECLLLCDHFATKFEKFELDETF